jgi:hypothetical protein
MPAPVIQQIVDDALAAQVAADQAAFNAEHALRLAAEAALAAATSGPAYTRWCGPGWFDASDTGIVNGVMTNKRSGGGDLAYAGTAGLITSVANAQNGKSALRVVRDVSTLSSAPRLEAAASARVSAMFAGNDLPYTVIAAYTPTDDNTSFIWSASRRIDAATVQNIALVRRPTPNSSIRRYFTDTSAEVNFGSGQPANTPVVVAVRHSGAKVSVWANSLTKVVNWAAQDTNSFTAALVFRLFAAEAKGATDPCFTQSQGNMDFYEAVIEDACRSEADIQQAMTDIASKWGITLS